MKKFTIAISALWLFSGCATEIPTVQLKKISFTPNQTTLEELIRQTGLPSQHDFVVVDGTQYERITYLKGPSRVEVYSLAPIILKSSAVTVVTSYDIRRNPDIAMECLISKEKIVVSCVSAGKS